MALQKHSPEETLQEAYPKEWEDIINQKVPKNEIDEYLLKFVAKLLREVKAKKIEEDCLGDGWSIVINMKENSYRLNPDVYGFLFRLGDYGLEEVFGHGDSEYGEMIHSSEEVESELLKVAKKFGISLNL